MVTPRRTIDQGGRPKAYRPMAEPERRTALRDGLAAYDRGDFFLAHEILEPAWMGAEDLAERELLQGLIKLAAAFVHVVRGNPSGVAKNLRGSLARIEAGKAAGSDLGIDVDALAGAIRGRLADLEGARAPVDAMRSGQGRATPTETSRDPASIEVPRLMRGSRGATDRVDTERD